MSYLGMYKEKLFLLFAYCIGIGYRGEKFGSVPKLMDPIFIGFIFPHIAIGVTFMIIVCFSFLYLFFSAVMKPYSRNKQVLIPILIGLTSSVLVEFFWFDKLSTNLKVYFVISVVGYAISVLYFWRGLKKLE